MIKCKHCDRELETRGGLNRHNKIAHNLTETEFKEQYAELYPKKEITEDMVQCKLCKDYYAKPLGMPSHLSRIHNLSVKEYYDQFCDAALG